MASGKTSSSGNLSKSYALGTKAYASGTYDSKAYFSRPLRLLPPLEKKKLEEIDLKDFMRKQSPKAYSLETPKNRYQFAPQANPKQTNSNSPAYADSPELYSNRLANPYQNPQRIQPFHYLPNPLFQSPVSSYNQQNSYQPNLKNQRSYEN